MNNLLTKIVLTYIMVTSIGLKISNLIYEICGMK